MRPGVGAVARDIGVGTWVRAYCGLGRWLRSVVDGVTDEAAEERILEFFHRPYVVRAQVDFLVAEKARYLVRQYALSGIDAVHLATALVYNAYVFETFDDKMIKKVIDGGLTGIKIRNVMFDGQKPML